MIRTRSRAEDVKRVCCGAVVGEAQEGDIGALQAAALNLRRMRGRQNSVASVDVTTSACEHWARRYQASESRIRATSLLRLLLDA
jgi:hypothetical protein